MTVKLLVGDVRDRIREIPDGSIDLIATSPPFLALRKYGDNAAEMGSERTPADFLDALLELTQEFRRVLAPHGSIAIELGDTYSGSGGAGGDYNEGGLRDGQERFNGSAAKARAHAIKVRTNSPGNGWPLAKSLTLIPTLYPASLAYGWNMLNPAHTFDRWRVRNVIVWARPNPPVGALGDKVRPATSYITVACTSPRRYFDLDGVRGNPEDVLDQRVRTTNGMKNRDGDASMVQTANYTERIPSNPAGAPPLDWWEDDDPTGHATLVLPTQPYPGAHYATWPEALAARLIKMMCPLRVCTTCGESSRRIVGAVEYVPSANPGTNPSREAGSAAEWDSGIANGQGAHSAKPDGGMVRQATTLGWSDCGHDTWRSGMILDPFAGSGTSLAVAQGLGRDATGIELYETNAELVRQRVGMFLDVA